MNTSSHPEILLKNVIDIFLGITILTAEGCQWESSAILFSLGQVDHVINQEKISSEVIIILALIELELLEPLHNIELDSEIFVGALE